LSSKTACLSTISDLKFPFILKKDQLEAIDTWLENGCRISVIYIAEELIYVNDTKDYTILKLVKAAIEKEGDTSKELFKEKAICHTSIKTKMKFNIPIILLSRIVTDHVLYYLILILN
jgi:hypothetical protein